MNVTISARKVRLGKNSKTQKLVLIVPAVCCTVIQIARLVLFVPSSAAKWFARVDRFRWTLAIGDVAGLGKRVLFGVCVAKICAVRPVFAWETWELWTADPTTVQWAMSQMRVQGHNVAFLNTTGSWAANDSQNLKTTTFSTCRISPGGFLLTQKKWTKNLEERLPRKSTKKHVAPMWRQCRGQICCCWCLKAESLP